MKITKEGRKERKTIIEEKRTHKQKVKEKGITLIALVVTIIILLILAGVTLTIALGQNGLISRTQNVVETYKKTQEDEELEISQLENMLEKPLGTSGNGESPGNPGGPTEPPTPPEEDEKPLVNNLKDLQQNTVEAVDKNGNPVVIPGEYKIAEDSGETVQEGIVIEDDEGNQFVWIPVSNIDGDNTETENEQNLITKNDGTKVEITLGRYSFDKTNGTPTLKQVGKIYEQTVMIGDCQETSNHPNGGVAAKDIKTFVESVDKNHGYYIGRYEASFRSGNTLENYKPAVKKSTSYNTSSMNYVSGTLWNRINQGNASKVSKNMYKDSEDSEAKYVESDLINSYAWDTAIVYIQKMGHTNYANATSSSTNLKNTGETGDEKCHIFDLAGNLGEWTTEYCTYVDDYGGKFPCVHRGYSRTVGRTLTSNDSPSKSTGFRPLLYLGSPES